LRDSLLGGKAEEALKCLESLSEALQTFESDIDEAVVEYCREGGFPEVWGLPDSRRKIEYLMEQQVRKVLYEDLAALANYRKPENVLRFFLYILGNPGREINMTAMAREAGVKRNVVEENLPRLEMTDLILRIRRFSSQPLRVRQGKVKCYPIDMALRNAVMKTCEPPSSAELMGLYAENLVARELSTWAEKIELTYYRRRKREVDFVFTHGGNRHLPIEVKHRRKTDGLKTLKAFMKSFKIPFGVIITRNLKPAICEDILHLPLRYFLLVA